jgi:hypothetical protein
MLMDDVEGLIRRYPGRTASHLATLLYGVEGDAERVNGVCRLLVGLGRIRREGNGKPGDPYTYHPAKNE